MKNIFINKNSQVRSGWKITTTWCSFFFGTNLLTGIIISVYILIMLAIKGLPFSAIGSSIDNIAGLNGDLNSGFGMFLDLIQCICMIFFVVLFWNVYDNKPIRDMGLINIKKGYKDLLKGLAFGAIS